jgi:hypothetical protein
MPKAGFSIEPTHELLGVEANEFSRELGTRKRGGWTGFVCEIVAAAVRSDPSDIPFTLPELASRLWPVECRARRRPSAVSQRQVHR